MSDMDQPAASQLIPADSVASSVAPPASAPLAEDAPATAAQRPSSGGAAPPATDRRAPSRPLTQVPLTAAQLALYAGWTMAVLYGRIPVPSTARPAELPTVHELPVAERMALELGRLRRLLERLAKMPECAGFTATTSGIDATQADFKARLEALNLRVLEGLAAAGLELELAYELGRSLRDTANPPADPGRAEAPEETIARQLARARIAQLQEWLATLSAEFPPQVSAIVAASIGRWSDFAAVTVGRSAKRRRRAGDEKEFAGKMENYLLQQGEVWLMLLIGARSTSGLLTPEGYVAAGEAALSRSARIVRGVLAHYWAVLLCVAVALGGILYLAAAELGGAAQVWTSIAAIGGAFGVTARSVSSAIGRVTAEAERPVFAAEEEAAKAWAITTMPRVELTPRGVRQLRRAGVTGTVSLGRV